MEYMDESGKTVDVEQVLRLMEEYTQCARRAFALGQAQMGKDSLATVALLAKGLQREIYNFER